MPSATTVRGSSKGALQDVTAPVARRMIAARLLYCSRVHAPGNCCPKTSSWSLNKSVSMKRCARRDISRELSGEQCAPDGRRNAQAMAHNT